MVVWLVGNSDLDRWFLSGISHIDTGEQRRQLYPLDLPLTSGAKEVVDAILFPSVSTVFCMLRLHDVLSFAMFNAVAMTWFFFKENTMHDSETT